MNAPDTYPGRLNTPCQRFSNHFLTFFESEEFDVFDVSLVQCSVDLLHGAFHLLLGQIEQLPITAWLDTEIACLDLLDAEVPEENGAGSGGG